MKVNGTGFKHYGQHDARTCFACKIHTITLDRGGPKTHMHNGSHWDDNPVTNRITELQDMARRLEAKETADAERKARELAAYQADQGEIR
jgi:hypothetical protein